MFICHIHIVYRVSQAQVHEPRGYVVLNPSVCYLGALNPVNSHYLAITSIVIPVVVFFLVWQILEYCQPVELLLSILPQIEQNL